jgi:hypothetical protein
MPLLRQSPACPALRPRKKTILFFAAGAINKLFCFICSAHHFLPALFTCLLLWAFPAKAEIYMVNGRPLNLLGYATQGAAWGLHGSSQYATESGAQSLLSTVLIESDYSVTDTLKLYGAAMYSIDWIYTAKHDDNSWNDKLFSRSRDRLYKDDRYWQVLKELHVTWTPGDFFFRAGKQIVAWGETDGFRLMDQLNPLDQRRGFTDVEFETTIIPIWLLRAEYSPPVSLGWITDPAIECIINPNVDFIPGQTILPGNDKGGIWAPEVDVTLPAIISKKTGRLGSVRLHEEKPGNWDSDGFELGIRLKAVILDSLVTLNYFNGVENDFIALSENRLPRITQASDGRPLVHPYMKAVYPDLRFAGATLSRDMQQLRSPLLGGVAPVVRLESFYGFDSTFVTTPGKSRKSDEIRWAVGIDWKVKLYALNPTAFFTVSPQIYHRKILRYPSSVTLQNMEDNNYMASLMLRTAYNNGKLMPSIFWLRDMTNRADMWRLQIDYQYSHNWQFTFGVLSLGGKEKGKGFEVFRHKDQMYVSISYRWG